MTSGADAARTELLTETTTENDAKPVPMASQPGKYASDCMIKAALQFIRETSDTLLAASTHNGARIVLPNESKTRAENGDNCTRPDVNG